MAGIPLLAYYPFEGNALDASGNGYHGTLVGPTLTAGHDGQAYAFDGNDFIRAAVNINPSVTPRLTMGGWVKAASNSGIRQVISHDSGGFDRSLGIDSRGGGRGWSAFAGSGGVLGFEPAVLQEWTFVAVVYDQPSRTVTLYAEDTVSGNLDVYRKSGSLSGGHNFIRIGSNPSFGEFFAGVIDSVFLISDAMTAEQIAAIHTGGAGALARLTPGASITGRVLLDDAPVPDARVQVCTADYQACMVRRSGPDGTYRAEGLSAGPYRIKAFPPSGLRCVLPGVVNTSVAPAEARTGVDVELARCWTNTDVVITHRFIRDGIPVVNWRDPLTVRAPGCVGGTATYELKLLDASGVVMRHGPMIETTPGNFEALIAPLLPAHGPAQVIIRVVCPDGTTTAADLLIYIDPSGNVRTTDGQPIEGATVTLYRSDEDDGPFEIVPDQSAIMSPANRTNPDQTDANGHFGWDVLAGYYLVRAEKQGCVSPADPQVAYVTSRIMAIPPPVTDLDLRLSCPPSNRAPTAGDDVVATDEDTPLVIPVATLLANDGDPDGDGLTVTGVSPTPSTHGAVSLAAGGVTYVPADNYHGPAGFTYTIDDGHGGTATAAVTVTVRAVNDVPVTAADAAQTDEDTSLVIPTRTLTANDSDADGDPLIVTAVHPTAATHGTVALAAGSVTYVPGANYHGPAEFTYTVDDGHGQSAVSKVTVTVRSVNDAPVCAAVTAAPSLLWPADHSLRTVVLSGATDPDGDRATIAVTTVIQDEPLNGPGDGETAPDAALGAALNEVALRAERSGTGDGRIYRVGFTVTDPHGGACTGTNRVGVPRNQGNGGQPVESALMVDSFGR